MNLIQANTNNLTALWEAAGQLAGQYIEEPGYQLTISESGEWPNKLWFTKSLDMQTLHDILLKWNLNELSLPIWGKDIQRSELILKMSGFEEKLIQVAMSMDLEDAPDHVGQVVLQKVTSKSLAETWSKLFEESFGYEISVETVIKTADFIEYFIGKHNGVPVGTAVLFLDQPRIAGIHSMGVIPTQRRKGYAQELLIHMLNIARVKGATHATLQASEMGKGLYLKTGFREDFIIKTFIKHKN
ncbi:GNAT family N-acetyltransferase [Ekhidna sp.]|uniref:GNAT family N-acetyltransferase n=1 Tax=Ekhidna sp. TaxID=2608089 RepID=UPI003C7D1194